VRRLGFLLAVSSLWAAGGCTTGGTRADTASFDAGYAAFQASQWQRAVDGFTRYLRSDPKAAGRGEVYYYRGESLVHLNRRPEAMNDFQQSLAAKAPQPIEAYTYIAIGNLYYEEGNDAAAVRAFDKALRGPQDELPLEATLLRLGTSLQRLGQWPMADKYLGLLLDRYPKSQAAAEARRRYKADGFCIQTGAYRVSTTAQQEAQRLRAAGFTPRLGQTQRDAQVLYTVQTGKAQTYAEAQVLAQQVVRSGFSALIVP
jgi:tetratricopeptide (TPR) repeat protein